MFIRVTKREPEGSETKASRRWLSPRRTIPLFAGIVAGLLAVHELHTSALQASLFATLAGRASFQVGRGESPRISFPAGGPFDNRRGYSSIPEFVDRLGEHGFTVSQQARMSPALRSLIAFGVAPPYRELSSAGLIIRGTGDEPLFDARRRERVFHSYEQVPPLIVDTLLFIENKELLQTDDPRRNPTLEWDRMAKASMLYVGSKIGFQVAVEGGSTLATQLEKFRHSPDGRTASGPDKLRQIASASLKAYRDGVDTSARRREIIVEYLNSMPLAAAAGFGEIHGLGEGLEAWFGLGLGDVASSLLDHEAPLELRAEHYAHVLALLTSLPAPSVLLAKKRDDLKDRMMRFLALMERAGVVDKDLAVAVRAAPLHFLARAPSPPPQDFVGRKAATAVRNDLLRMTGVDSHYELNQLHVEVEAAIDVGLQEGAIGVFRKLADRRFIAANGLKGRHLLGRADPSKVLYGLLLYERTPDGNLLRTQADNLDQPFDLNRGAKVELGSTAKLRTLAHYLEIIAILHEELSSQDTATLRIRRRAARDPLTRWVAETLSRSPGLDLETTLDRAMLRRYSAGTTTPFFTGGGLRYFRNFARSQDATKPSLRTALVHSVNLPFVRLMRDLVEFHEARLPYDSKLVLEDIASPVRQRMLTEIAEKESRAALKRSFRKFQGKQPAEIIETVLGKERRREKRLRKLSILHYAWFPDANDISLAIWLNRWFGRTSASEVNRMRRAYGNPELNLADFGYLASQHTLVLWSAGQLLRDPGLSWQGLILRSGRARFDASRWLFKERNVRPQNRRLRVRIERDAFASMVPYWQRLGFPFERMVPSYASALGSSGDRPAALAQLLGIIVNDGVDAPFRKIVELRFARATPYETALRPDARRGDRVMPREVAQALRAALTGVVNGGTASALRGAFKNANSDSQVGGKTGTGDNRRKTFDRWGGLKSSRAMNRTASFAFFIDDRFFGVVTAFVPGPEADNYHFTSKLPLMVLKLMSPAINARLSVDPRLELAGR